MTGPQASPRGPTPAPAHAAIVARVSSRAALWVGAAWGFAEATFLFIVPDVWLGFVALFAPRRMLVTLGAILVGAAAGAACLYLATLAWPDALENLILAVPAIAPADLEHARSQLQADGAVAILPAVAEGRPVKLYAHAAAVDGIGLLEVVAFTVLNRLARLLLVGGLMLALGSVGRSVVARWPGAVAASYVVAWIVFYAVYLASHRS